MRLSAGWLVTICAGCGIASHGAWGQPTNPPLNLTATAPVTVSPSGVSTAPRVIGCPSCATGAGQWTAGTVTALATGLTIAATTLTPSWQSTLVTSIDAGLSVPGGALTADWHGGVVSALDAALAINSGTLTPSWRAGAATAIGSGLTLTAGTLSNTNPTASQWQAGTVTAAGLGVGINGGTVAINNVVTIAGTAAGTATLAAATGTSDVVLTMPASGGTVTLACAPAFIRQRFLLDVKQGATAGILTLGTAFIFGSSPASFTLTATAAAIDRLMIISPDATHCAVMAIDQGFSF